LILNWSLPHLGGLQLLRHVRQVLQQDNIRVLMLARDDDTNTKKCVRGLDCGADDFMTLPLSLLELSARVRALLRRLRYLKDGQPFDWTPHAIQPHFNTLWHGELILDRPERTAYLAGQSLHLSRGEFELLTCLMQDPGRCYSRAELQQSIWQQCQAPGDRSVDNIVLRLRRKLGIYRGDLETVWGVGYRLKPR
ncbi:MAG TPA: response regulator transcription factor, partial [Caldilineaceae bacterium]|nr:response regulator transcription factor [Caldilineaceae bacterium]